MSEEGQARRYCTNCGAQIRPGKAFCGDCGAAVLPSPPRAEQVIPKEIAAAQGARSARRRRTTLVWALGLGALLIVLVGGGALAALTFRDSLGVLGGGDPGPVGSGSTSEDDSTDDVERFVSDYYEALDRENWEATYSMLDKVSQGKFTEEEWASKQQALQDADPDYPPPLKSVTVNNLGRAGREILVNLTLDYQGDARESANIEVVPENGEYKRHLTEEEIAYLRGASGDGEEARSDEEAIEATIRGHYEAIGAGDFEEAYSYFGPAFRSTTDKQTWIAEEESYSITDSTVDLLVVEEISGNLAAATVYVSFEDNTGSPRFYILWGLVREAGEWKLDEVLTSEKLDAGTSNEGSQEGVYSTEEMYSGEIVREITVYLDGYDEGVMRSAADELRSTDPDHAVLFIHYVDSEGRGIGTGVAFRDVDAMAEFGSAFYRDDSATWEDEEGIIIREESYGEYGAELEEDLLTESKPYTPIWSCQDLEECPPI